MACTPQNDLNCYFNGEWMRKHKSKIPFDSFKEIQGKINGNVNKIINRIVSNPSNRTECIISKFHQSYDQRFSAMGFIRSLLEKIDHIQSVRDLTKVVCTLISYDISTFLDIDVCVNYEEPKIFIMSVGDGDTVLGSRELYLGIPVDPIQKKANMKLFKSYNEVIDIVESTINQTGIKTDPMFKEDIKLFEFVVSKYLNDVDEENDPFAISNKISPKDFRDRFDFEDFWTTIISTFNREDNQIKYSNERYLTFLKRFFKEGDSLRIVKAYLSFRLIMTYGYYLPDAERFSQIYARPYDPLKIYVDTVISLFGKHIEDIFEQENKVPSKRYAIANTIMKSMLKFCRSYWEKTKLFDESTKVEAIKKLSATTYIMGRLPGKRLDIGLDLAMSTDLFQNMALLSEENTFNLFNKIGITYDQSDLGMLGICSCVLNAYCFQDLNMIYIPTAMLISDLFIDETQSLLYNYGGLGSVVGHEVMHLFDNSGSVYDSKGNLHDWWSERDRESYEKEVQKIRNHYETLMVNGFSLNPSNTIGEDIADICGLKISLRSFLAKKGQKSSDLTLFFKRWADIWKHVYDDHRLSRLITTDVHSPHVIRINAPFAHMQEYYDTFGPIPSDMVYVPPGQRCRLMD